jgi:hypothetical protein
VLNNPLNFNDPSGNKACDDEFGCDNPSKPVPLPSPDEPGNDIPHNGGGRKNGDNEEERNCRGLGCLNDQHDEDNISLPINITGDPPPPELSNGEKFGLIFLGVSMVVGFTVAEATFLYLGIGALEAGPLGVVVDLAIVVPVELLLIDVEIGVARNIYNRPYRK